MDCTLFFTLVLLVPECLGSRPCCQGDNILAKKKCIDGSPIVSFACDQKYLAVKDSSFTVDANDNLVVANSRIPPDQYCATRYNNSEAFIVCFSDNEVTGNEIYVFHGVLELISVFFIVITIWVYLQVTDLLDLQGICILHSISGLAISFVVLAINQLSTTVFEKIFCLTCAYTMYFSMLYAFFWLNVLSFHIWRTMAKPRFLKNHRYWLHIYHAFGIGGSTALLIFLLIASSMQTSDIHPGLGETKCWFKTTKSQFIYFYAPLALLLILNIIYYGWTLTILWRNLTKCDEKKAKVLKYKVLLCFKLFFIMGISWIFELLSAIFPRVNSFWEHVWQVTDCLNTLQGFFIFLILVVLRKRVIRNLARRSFCGFRLPSAWQTVADDECEETEEEFGLSEAQPQKN